MLRKVFSILKLVISSRFKFKAPAKSSILIFDVTNSSLLNPYLNEYNPSYLATRNEEFNFPILVLSLFQSGSKKLNYYKRYIKAVNPKLVITFQDNNTFFYQLSDSNKYKTLFIQNGLRGYYADIFSTLDVVDTQKFKVDLMLTFGKEVGKRYLKHITGKNISIGAFKNNITPAQTVRKTPSSLTYVSQWHSDGFYMGEKFYEHHEFYTDIEKPILSFLEYYCSKHNKKLRIIPRHLPETSSHDEERKYFESILKGKVEFLSYEGDNFSSYKALHASEVVLTIDSTLGYEAAVRGVKTAFFSVRSHLYKIPGLSFGWPGDFGESGEFWTNIPDTKIYEKVLDNLFELKDDAWQPMLDRINFDEILKYDPNNTILQRVLDEELGNSSEDVKTKK